MSKGAYLGEFEQIVLLALLRLDRNAYGVPVRQEIEERTGRAVSIGAVYATLERLEAKRYVESSVANPTPQRGGRAKRYFRLTAEGAAALKQSRDSMERMWKGLKPGWSAS